MGGALIWRKGGQSSIDDKIEWGTKVIGSSLVLRVNVVSCCLVVLQPYSGGGKNNEWVKQFEFSVDGKVLKCEYEGKLSSGWKWSKINLDGCVIQTEKGKHDLEIKYVSKTMNGFAAIDMIA